MTALLLILVCGSAVFSILAIIAALRYRGVRPPGDPEAFPPVSVLKPLHGLDEGLEANLCSFFEQRYERFEILFAVEEASDSAVPIVKELLARYPDVPARLLIVGSSPLPNAKVHSLRGMVEQSANELLVMVDSDVRVDADYLRTVVAELEGRNVALVTSPYRAIGGPTLWSRLEALGLNTEFISGVFVARMLGGMDFALGPAIATRKGHLEEIGGLEQLQEFLAEDFVMGNRMAARGHKVVLSSQAVEHRIGSQDFSGNFSHRLRWNRSTRRSRPAGYIGQLFTYPTPLALALLIWNPELWPVSAVGIGIRYLSGWTSARALGARVDWVWLGVQDLLSFASWVGGFVGNEIVWRGRRFTVDRNGRFRPVGAEPL